MCRLGLVAFILFFVAGKSSGVKWVQLETGDPLPRDTTNFPDTKIFVGRARHFNSIEPARVWPNSSATIRVCDKEVPKHKFEVLTSTKPCFWQHIQSGDNLPEGLLLVGHTNANRPIFIGWKTTFNSYYPHSNSGEMHTFSLIDYGINYLAGNDIKVLVCPSERVWLDVSAKKVPKNAVSAGKSPEGKDIFVARLMNGCQIYPGQVVPEEKIATAWSREETIEARYCQVLVGADDQYSWVSIVEDKFPDNAVVGSTDDVKLYYVAKDLSNNVSTYINSLFTEALNRENYRILVENFKDVELQSTERPRQYHGHHVFTTTSDRPLYEDNPPPFEDNEGYEYN